MKSASIYLAVWITLIVTLLLAAPSAWAETEASASPTPPSGALVAAEARRNCQAHHDAGYRQSGLYLIDANGHFTPPKQLWCQMRERHGLTLVLTSLTPRAVSWNTADAIIPQAVPHPDMAESYKLADRDINSLLEDGQFLIPPASRNGPFLLRHFSTRGEDDVIISGCPYRHPRQPFIGSLFSSIERECRVACHAEDKTGVMIRGEIRCGMSDFGIAVTAYETSDPLWGLNDSPALVDQRATAYYKRKIEQLRADCRARTGYPPPKGGTYKPEQFEAHSACIKAGRRTLLGPEPVFEYLAEARVTEPGERVILYLRHGPGS